MSVLLQWPHRHIHARIRHRARPGVACRSAHATAPCYAQETQPSDAHGDMRTLAPIYVKSLAVGDEAPDALELSSEFDDEPAANDSNA